MSEKEVKQLHEIIKGSKLTPRAIRVLNYMTKYGSISPLKALHELGDFRLSATIFELRQHYEIDMKLKNSPPQVEERLAHQTNAVLEISELRKPYVPLAGRMACL